MKKILVSLITLVALSQVAFAEDVYNFYFQKNKAKTVEKKKEKKNFDDEMEALEEDVADLEDEIIEVDDDVLLVPDNWEPAKKKKKKYYLKRRKKENTSKTVAKTEGLDDNRSGWAVSLGVGTIQSGFAYNDFGNVFTYEVDQRVYKLGARYNMSKYFHIDMDLMVANGDAEISQTGGTFETMNFGSNIDPIIGIGLGVTPIHLKIFGSELIELGVDGGVLTGLNQSFLASGDGDNSEIYLGPRVGVNLSDHFSLYYRSRFLVDDERSVRTHSFNVAYRW